MASELQSNWGAAVRGVGVQFREFFDQTVDSLVASWDPVVRTVGDNGAQATFSGKTGAGRLTRFAEGSAVPKKSRFKLYDTAFAHEQYGGQLEISRKQLMNRDWSSEFNEFKDLSVSAQVTLSHTPAQIFNGAFATTTSVNGVKLTTYNDGKPLASTIHPRVDGGSSQSNASSTGIPLTENNLEVARLALVLALQDDGNPLTISGPIYLVVPTDLEKQATIITGSSLRSNTANNDLNFYEGGSFPVMASHWLSSTNSGSATAWFLVAPSLAQLMLIKRAGPELDQSIDKNTKSTLFDVILDLSVGSADWRGFWASKGDLAAYAS